jgi:virginiamycin B lyase
MKKLMAIGCLGVLSTFLISQAVAQKLPDGKGKEIVEAACDGCHGVDQIIGRAWSEEKWKAVLKSMVDKGAVLSDDEMKTIVAYLVANFGEAPAKPK